MAEELVSRLPMQPITIMDLPPILDGASSTAFMSNGFHQAAQGWILLVPMTTQIGVHGR